MFHLTLSSNQTFTNEKYISIYINKQIVTIIKEDMKNLSIGIIVSFLFIAYFSVVQAHLDISKYGGKPNSDITEVLNFLLN